VPVLLYKLYGARTILNTIIQSLTPHNSMLNMSLVKHSVTVATWDDTAWIGGMASGTIYRSVLSPLASSLTHSVFHFELKTCFFWQIISSVDLFLSYRTDSTDSRTI